MKLFGQVGQSREFIRLQASDLPQSYLREQRKPRGLSLLELSIQTSTRWVVHLIVAVLGIFFQLLGKTTRSISIHRILVSGLLASCALNMAFSGRESLKWWQEWQNNRYLQEFGFRSQGIMARSIHLQDMEPGVLLKFDSTPFSSTSSNSSNW